MDALAKLLKEHYDNYSNMEIQDAVKFLFQSHMGPGHLIAEEAAALTSLEAEWSTVDMDRGIPLSEPLGNGFSRLNISACKADGLSIRTVGRLFFLTAQTAIPAPEKLDKSLDLVRELPFPSEEADAFVRPCIYTKERLTNERI